MGSTSTAEKRKPIAHRIDSRFRTQDVVTSDQSHVTFSSLLLSDRVASGLQRAGFERPSPVQLKAIPLGRCGLDLIVQAKSGTGKTCVFSVVALEAINAASPTTQVLVLAPTREIALQIQGVVSTLGLDIPGLQCHVFIGGLPLREDRIKLQCCHIAVGSPGRVKQLIEGGLLKTSGVRLLVLDEADKLLEDSFQEQINWIYSSLPANKQVLALSATYPEYLARHLTNYMRNPTHVRLNSLDPALRGIHQYYQTVENHPVSHRVFEAKVKHLTSVLSAVSFNQCLLFSNYQLRAQSLSDRLSAQGWPVTYIAGSLDQTRRSEALEQLTRGRCRILISTDLTARGIDAENVNLVINLDLPADHETYLHRIGRAGRFGTHGAAITYISRSEDGKLKDLQELCSTVIAPLPGPPIPDDLVTASFVTTDVVSSVSESSQCSIAEHVTEDRCVDAGELDNAIDELERPPRLSSGSRENCVASQPNWDVLREVPSFSETLGYSPATKVASFEELLVDYDEYVSEVGPSPATPQLTHPAESPAGTGRRPTSDVTYSRVRGLLDDLHLTRGRNRESGPASGTSEERSIVSTQTEPTAGNIESRDTATISTRPRNKVGANTEFSETAAASIRSRDTVVSGSQSRDSAAATVRSRDRVETDESTTRDDDSSDDGNSSDDPENIQCATAPAGTSNMPRSTNRRSPSSNMPHSTDRRSHWTARQSQWTNQYIAQTWYIKLMSAKRYW